MNSTVLAVAGRGWLALLGVCGLGCYGDEHGPDDVHGPGHVGEVAEPLAICDGSEEIRFGYDASGGFFSNRSIAFFEQYGTSFLYVRGDCRYVAARAPDGRFSAGTLSAEDADELSSEAGYRTLDRRARGPERPPCFDAPVERMHGPSATLHCSCCGGLVPRTVARLTDQGTPLAAAVTLAVASANETPEPSWPAWPLATPISRFSISPRTIPGPGDGERVDDPDDAASLHALRREFAQVRDDVPVTFVRNGSLAYALFIRDELPEDMEAGVQALLSER